MVNVSHHHHHLKCSLWFVIGTLCVCAPAPSGLIEWNVSIIPMWCTSHKIQSVSTDNHVSRCLRWPIHIHRHPWIPPDKWCYRFYFPSHVAYHGCIQSHQNCLANFHWNHRKHSSDDAWLATLTTNSKIVNGTKGQEKKIIKNDKYTSWNFNFNNLYIIVSLLAFWLDPLQIWQSALSLDHVLLH